MDFNGKVVIITGASSGIGAACSLHLASLNAKLAIVGRNVDKLADISAQCEEISGAKPLSIIADITVEENNDRIVQETLDRYGKLDVLVNNAGFLTMSGVFDNISNFDKMVSTNVRGTYLLTQKAIPHLIETKGNIVNVSSIVSTVAIPNMMAYSMTKASLDIFTKCVASELASKGVRVNSVNPGPVITNLFKTSGLSDEDSDKLYASVGTAMPLRKVANAEDVAKLITFLASENASCITGTINMIDCGLHLGEPVI